MTDPNEVNDMHAVFENALSAISALRDKTISAVVSHSDTTKHLSQLQERFDNLSQRMDSVVNEAQRVRQDLSMVIAERDKYKLDAETNLSLANTYSAERDEARKDASEQRQQVTQLGSELAEANRKLEAANHNVISLGQDLEWLRRSSASLREQFNDEVDTRLKAEKELKQANERLAKLQGVFKDMFSEPEPSPVVEPHYTETGNFNPPSVQAAGEDRPNTWDKYLSNGEPNPDYLPF